MSSKLKDFGPYGDQRLLVFFCPGCNSDHPFHVPRWTWNGSFESPTFTPSLLVYPSNIQVRCHSFVTDGKIQFLADCEHKLAGQTVEIPDYDS